VTVKLDRPQLRRLLILLSNERHGRLDQQGEKELRAIVRGQGYDREADGIPLGPVIDVGHGILFAYHVIHGIHVDSLVDEDAQPA
jgi:hypothetical protein